jgi:GxxExxY protein
MHHGDTENTESTERSVNGLTEKIIGAAIEVHRILGPGLLESAYEECLAQEMLLQGLKFKRQQPLPVTFKDLHLECAYRLDFVVEGRVILELKAVERILQVHEAQLLTYLRLSGLKWGLILNFHASVLKHGIRRMIN